MDTTMLAVGLLVIGLGVAAFLYAKEKADDARKEEAWRLSPLNKNGINFDQAIYDAHMAKISELANK